MRDSASGFVRPSGSIDGTWRGRSGVWTKDDEELAVYYHAVDMTEAEKQVRVNFMGAYTLR